jgi:hypothetical protein
MGIGVCVAKITKLRSLLGSLKTNCKNAFMLGSTWVNRVNVVGIATGYWLDDRGLGVHVPAGSRIFSSPRRPDRHWGPPSLLSNGYRGALSPGVKRQDREADH